MPNEKKPIPPLSIVVPAVLDWDWHTPDEIVAELLEQQEQFGINRFMLAFPSKGYRSVDFPTMAYVEQYARNFKEVRERVAPLGIQCGWWFCGTVKLGHGVWRPAAFTATEDGICLLEKTDYLHPVHLLFR